MRKMSDQPQSNKGSDTVQMGLLFIVWYAFNAGYNVYNSSLKVLHFPIAVSVGQLAVGLVYALPMWVLGIRKAPSLKFDDIVRLFPIIAVNALGHAATVVATFQKGGGSFTHVIKASEPVVSVLFGLLLNGSVPKPLTALSLLPITYGVAYASTLGNLSIASLSKEFTTKAATMAMIGNVSYALRSVLRKNLPADFKARTNLTPANDHAITTIFSAILIIPFVLYFETFDSVMAGFNSLGDQNKFLTDMFICGICFYIYNEVQNIVLGSLGPVTTAVGNTLKRVVIFVALYYFTAGETFPVPKIVGCAIAVLGCLAYAILNSKKL